MSLAKVLGTIYALIGLLFGGLFSITALLGGNILSGDANVFGIIFGIGSLIFIPLLYAFFGFIGGFIAGLLYNVAAKWVGGIEIEI